MIQKYAASQQTLSALTDVEKNMFAFKKATYYGVALAYFGVSLFEYTIHNSTATGLSSLWALVWFVSAGFLGFCTFCYISLLITGKLQATNGPLTFGIPIFTLPKKYYYLVMTVYLSIQTFKHLIAGGDFFSSIFHLVMLALGIIALIFSVTGLRSFMKTDTAAS